MGLIDNKKSMSLKMKIESSVAVFAIIVSVIFFLVLRNGCLVAANLHSNSGNALSTGSDRRVSAELNNTQTVKLQNDSSRAEFQKTGKRLELKLAKNELNIAIKGLDYDKDQDPSETPTPVPAEETTEEVQTPMPTPVTSPADALTPVTEWSSDAEVTKEPANNPEPVPRSSYTSTPISSVASTPPNIITPIPALDCSGNTGTSVRDVTS